VTSMIDISVFKAPSQTTDGDRVALETIRGFVSINASGYNYLEIGSFLGGTLLPHLTSPHCARVLSIDRRTSLQPDERRASGYCYKSVTTANLIDELRKHLPDESSFAKLETFDGVIEDIDAEAVKTKYLTGFQLCFIDAEHTNEAVFSDFLHTLKLSGPNTIIMLHDSWMLGSGIRNIICYLRFTGTPFYFRRIEDSVTAFFLGRYSDPERLPPAIQSRPFVSEEYFREANVALWDGRTKEMLRALPFKTLINELTRRVKKKVFSRIRMASDPS